MTLPSSVALALLGLLVGAGLVALLSPKGGARHVAAGRLFHALALGSAVIAAPAALLVGDRFLAVLAGLTGYLVHAGRREVVRHRESASPGAPDVAGVLALLALGTVLLAGAADVLDDAGAPEAAAPILGGFALLLLFLAGAEAWRLLRGRPGPHGWLVHHVGAMGVAWIAAATALGVLVHPWLVLPGWVPWLGPTLLGVPVVLRWQARIRAEGRAATFF